jgi:hypothetical protein
MSTHALTPQSKPSPVPQVRPYGALQQHPAPYQVVPTTPILEKQTYASTMSFVGITRRTTAWIRRVGGNPAAAIAAIAAGLIFLAMMYALIVVWYFFTLVIFGWLLFPFRLIRRSHRKQEHLQRQQLATMQAILVQQQQALGANQQV